MMMNYNNPSATTSSSSDFPPNPHHILQTFHNYATNQQQIPTSSTIPKRYPNINHNNPRKKRTKLIRINSHVLDRNSPPPPPPPLALNIVKPKGNNYGKKAAESSSAPKITRPCTECGKRFWSLKALFGHMRCHPERQWRGINPPPNLRRPQDNDTTNVRMIADDNDDNLTEEDHQVASCLLMLANVVPPPIASTSHLTSSSNVAANTTIGYQGFPDYYSDSVAVRDRHHDHDDHVATVAVLGCQGDIVSHEDHMDGSGAGPSGVKCCRFECSSCKKVFGSHQALGGHRASHKNVKGCFAITRNDGDEEHSVGDHGDQLIHVKDRGDNNVDVVDHHNKMSSLMVFGHRCSICLRVFSSGQALGGHKRCHWEKGEDPSSLTHGGGAYHYGTAKEEAASASASAPDLDLNLNLNLPPAPVEDDHSSSSFSSGLSLNLRLGL